MASAQLVELIEERVCEVREEIVQVRTVHRALVATEGPPAITEPDPVAPSEKFWEAQGVFVRTIVRRERNREAAGPGPKLAAVLPFVREFGARLPSCP